MILVLFLSQFTINNQVLIIRLVLEMTII